MPSFSHPMKRRSATAHDYRAELGAYIRELRESRGMTQADLAKAVGMSYFTAISAIELGRNGVPPERYHAFAEAPGVPSKTFIREVLRLTNPWAWAMLTAADPKAATEEVNEALGTRLGGHMQRRQAP